MFVCELSERAWRAAAGRTIMSIGIRSALVPAGSGAGSTCRAPLRCACAAHRRRRHPRAGPSPTTASRASGSSGSSWWFKKVFRAGDELRQPRTPSWSSRPGRPRRPVPQRRLPGPPAQRHVPFRQDVRELLKDGDNVLIVRVTSGLEYYDDLGLSKIRHLISAEHKRGAARAAHERRAVFVRKPQYVYGWDWKSAHRQHACTHGGRAHRGLRRRGDPRRPLHHRADSRSRAPRSRSKSSSDNIRIIATLERDGPG